MDFKATEPAELPGTVVQCPHPGLLATLHVQVGRWGRGMVTQPRRGDFLFFLAVSGRVWPAGPAGRRPDHQTDPRPALGRAVLAVCCLGSGTPHSYWQRIQVQAPRMVYPFSPSITQGPAPTHPASASVGSSMSHMSHRCLCSANSHRGRPVRGGLGRDTCLNSAEGSCIWLA